MEESRGTVLIVDDDEDFLAQMRLMVESQGFATVTAGTRAEAETWLDGARPDLAVLDLMMENLDDGFLLAWRIKKLDPAIPVIMVTGVTAETGMEFDAAAPDEQGWIKADAILAKPVRPEQLRREIDRLTRR